MIADGPNCSSAWASRWPGESCACLRLPRAEEPRRDTQRDRHAGGVFARQQRVIGGERARHAHQNGDILQCTEHHAFQPECMAAMPPERLRCFTWVKPAFSIILRERGLRRKAPDAFGEIAIGRAVARHQLAEPRQHGEGIEIVEIVQPGRCDAGEFETEKPPARLEHAIGFAERLVEMGDVADAEGDRIGVLARSLRRAAIRRRRRARRWSRSFASGAAPALAQHVLVEVADRDRRGAAFGAQALSDAEGDVAGAAGDIEDRPAGLRVQPVDERVLPQAMDARRHQIVHQVVARGDRGEHVADQRRLLFRGHVAVAEGDGRVGVVHGGQNTEYG